MVALSAVLTARTPWGRRLSDTLAALIGPLPLSACLALAAASGLVEEALFRGLLQDWVGWLPASLLFGLAHYAPGRGLWPWTLFSIGAGLVLGALYAHTGNLVAPAVAHFGINAVNLPLLARRVPSADAGDRVDLDLGAQR